MRRGRRNKTAPSALPPGDLTHPFAPQEAFSSDKIAQMHELALKVLEELGIKVLLDEAREVFAAAGARVDNEMVYIGSDIVEAALAMAPRSFDLMAINPARTRNVALGQLIFSPGGGCPNVTDRINGRRPGCQESYRNATRLMQSFDVIGKLSPAPEPQDVPAHLRHYEFMQTQIGLSDKPISVYARGRAQVMESFEMISLAFRLSDEAFRAAPWASTVINTNSPRLIDKPMAQGLLDFARMGQISIITPFCLAGAMAPITVAGALVLQHAEALAGITLAQLARAGAPVVYGAFGSNVDMKSGAPAFGTATHIQMAIGSGQLARHIGLPWRSAAGAASNTNDMQAAGETHMSLWGTLMGGATFVFHSAGWLEGGLTFGFEKFINDIEALQTVAELCEPPDASDDALGFEAITEVAPSGHFFETKQTMDRYSDAFRDPLVADLSNFGTWTAAGAKTADERATQIWQDVLANFTPPEGSEERTARIAQYAADGAARGGAPLLE